MPPVSTFRDTRSDGSRSCFRARGRSRPFTSLYAQERPVQSWKFHAFYKNRRWSFYLAEQNFPCSTLSRPLSGYCCVFDSIYTKCRPFLPARFDTSLLTNMTTVPQTSLPLLRSCFLWHGFLQPFDSGHGMSPTPSSKQMTG